MSVAQWFTLHTDLSMTDPIVMGMSCRENCADNDGCQANQYVDKICNELGVVITTDAHITAHAVYRLADTFSRNRVMCDVKNAVTEKFKTMHESGQWSFHQCARLLLIEQIRKYKPQGDVAPRDIYDAMHDVFAEQLLHILTM